jgi:hypothetical protein
LRVDTLEQFEGEARVAVFRGEVSPRDRQSPPPGVVEIV